MSQPELLVLVCAVKTCRWRPPDNLEIGLVQAHFDLEEGHDPNDLRLELVAWCHHCQLEMPLLRTQPAGPGQERVWFQCGSCRRTRWVMQNRPGGGGRR